MLYRGARFNSEMVVFMTEQTTVPERKAGTLRPPAMWLGPALLVALAFPSVTLTMQVAESSKR